LLTKLNLKKILIKFLNTNVLLNNNNSTDKLIFSKLFLTFFLRSGFFFYKKKNFFFNKSFKFFSALTYNLNPFPPFFLLNDKFFFVLFNFFLFIFIKHFFFTKTNYYVFLNKKLNFIQKFYLNNIFLNKTPSIKPLIFNLFKSTNFLKNNLNTIFNRKQINKKIKIKIIFNDKQKFFFLSKHKKLKKLTNFFYLSSILFKLLKNSKVFYKRELTLFELNNEDVDSRFITRLTRRSNTIAPFELFTDKLLSKIKFKRNNTFLFFKYLLYSNVFDFNFFFTNKFFEDNAHYNTYLFKIKKNFKNFKNFKFVPLLFNNNKYITFFAYTQYEFLIFFFNKILFFKYFIYLYFFKKHVSKLNYFYKILNKFNSCFNKNNNPILNVNNFLPTKFFFLLIKKKFIKVFKHDKFNCTIAPFYNNTLIRFLENISGKKIFIKFYSFVGDILNFHEKLICII
jgi:hypothetical protein